MRNLLFLLAITFSGITATAQQTNTTTGKDATVAQENTVSGPKASPSWFVPALIGVLGGAAYMAFRYTRRNAQPRKRKGTPKRLRKSKALEGVSTTGKPDIVLETKTPGTPPPEAGAATAVLLEKPPLHPENTTAETATAVQPAAAEPAPEIFYMTVPGADGRFGAGAKKTQPSGCLYRFEVIAGKPDEALLFFSGNEDDMRNAQAFRDLELMPACMFNVLPDGSSFRFSQQPGRAHFDGTAWAVQQKIEITFL